METPMTSLDRNELEREARELLEALVAIDTTNPPGNEGHLADYLGRWFQDRDIESLNAGPEPGRENLIARLPGTGEKKPILLLAHADVVGVERDNWESDPFAPEERDGYLYGRGVLDDKGMMAVEAVALARLKRAGEQLSRDVMVLAAADEEAGGTCGVRWLMENRPELIEAEYALNEGGEALIAPNGAVKVMVQAAEKVACNVTLIAHGTSGHASVPIADNPVIILSRAVSRITERRERIRLNPVTRAYFRAMAADSGGWRVALGGALSLPMLDRSAARAFTDDPAHSSMLRNSISPTIVKGGLRANVIPAEARATLNCRLLPGEDVDRFIDSLKKTVSDRRVEFKWEQTTEPSPASPIDGPFYRLIADTAASVWTGATVYPYMSTGATDSSILRSAGIETYGLVPLPQMNEDWERMHGHNERLRLGTLGEGVEFVYELVRAIAST
jgi:acetylornithine deacetylase/succinyl-diaminopimelate desuccinylase-like protein